MKSKVYAFILVLGVLLAFSCKKDARQGGESPANLPKIHTLEQGLVSFSINGELVPAVIDTVLNTITVTLPNGADLHSLATSFVLASQVNATINSTAVNSGGVIDLSQALSITVSSADKTRTTSFKIVPQTELQYFGLGGIISAQKSLDKGYDFYYDQFDGSSWQAINCGPTVTTMAIKWADPTFTKKPVDARNKILSSGGWWFTSHVQEYLTDNNISSKIDTLASVEDEVKENIDNGNLLILCLDMFSVPYNQLMYQHTQKFYPTSAAGWGHFLLVKGYKQTDSNFYLEIYDPYSGGLKYNSVTTSQYMGQDRYYLSTGIKTATDIWWPYTIIVAPKGKVLKGTSHLKVNGITKPIPVASGQ
jgi:hypothetical protein